MAIRQGRKAAGNTLIGGLGGMHTYGCVAQRTSSLHRQCFSSESRGGRPGLSQSLIVIMVSVDVKQQLKKEEADLFRVQELCEC